MRTRLLSGVTLWTLLAVAFLIAGCGDDDYKDVDGQSPVLNLTTDHIRTVTGHEFIITGKVEDKDGIRSIRLQNAELHFDKIINLQAIYENPVYEYDLRYAFTIPAKTKGDNFTIAVTVTDLGGRTTKETVLVTMDGDFTAPVFKSISNPSKTEVNLVLSEGTTLAVKFVATDNKGLEYLEVDIPELDINERVTAGEEVLKEMTFDKTVTFPADKIGTYQMVLRAMDLQGNSEEKIYSVLVSRVPDYANMYLVDFEGNDAKLLTDKDVWGVPMPIERTGNLKYKARYYSEKANTPIRFITSKTKFDVCFGDDKNNPGKLTHIAADLQPIILPAKGYYEIVFDTDTEEYTVKAYTPEDAPLAIGSKMISDEGTEYEFKMGLIGGWFDNAPGWDGPKKLYYLAQDPDNPYWLTAEIIYTRQNSFDVTISPYHPEGWWTQPSWRFDGKNESFLTNTNESSKQVAIGRYTFIFDTHLGQSKLIKK